VLIGSADGENKWFVTLRLSKLNDARVELTAAIHPPSTSLSAAEVVPIAEAMQVQAPGRQAWVP
jgi:hypothetical protein